jgi:hypothetical protein
VLLCVKNLLTKRPLKKFNIRYLRPFIVLKKVRKLVYKLKLLPFIDRVYLVFNVLLLKL